MNDDQRQRLRLRFERINWQPMHNFDAVDAIYQQLTPRQPQESLERWLRRAMSAHLRQFKPVTEIVRRAAADGQLADSMLYSEDEQFRLTVQQNGALIDVRLQALGMALESYAGQIMGVRGRQSAAPLVVFELDQNGQCQLSLPNDQPHQQLFLLPGVCPVIGIIESGA